MSYYTTHNKSDIDIRGTSRQGSVKVRFGDLVDALGNPMYMSPKVKNEFQIKSGNVVATIHRYKPAGAPRKDGEYWFSVGGDDERALNLVRDVLTDNGVKHEFLDRDDLPF